MRKDVGRDVARDACGGAGEPADADHPLTAMFRDIRDELMSTLVYLLGNADDAQEAAQEAFLKCWRTRESVPDIQQMLARPMPQP